MKEFHIKDHVVKINGGILISCNTTIKYEVKKELIIIMDLIPHNKDNQECKSKEYQINTNLILIKIQISNNTKIQEIAKYMDHLEDHL